MTEHIRKFSRELPVTLNDAELQAYGKLLADKVHSVEMKEDSKKQEMARRSAEIKTLNIEIKRLADARLKGEELRPVQCGERLLGNVIEIVRLDRFEVVDSRPADLQDLQVPMKFDDGGDPGDGDPIDEGPRGDQIGSDAELGLDQPEWRAPSNVLPFTGANVESSTGDTVHVGDEEDRDEETEKAFGHVEEFENEDAEPTDPPEGEATATNEDEWLDKKLEERESSKDPAKTVAPKKVTRSRSAKVNATKPGAKKKR